MRYYRNWRSRGSGYGPSSKYSVLQNMFGAAVGEIRGAFLALDDDALDELLSDYGSMHGEPAEKYARATFPKWKLGSTKLSGQTMERLVELVPPYLSSEKRFEILQKVLEKNKPSGLALRTIIKINVEEPALGFAEMSEALFKMSHEKVLAHLPGAVMKAASWLYDDDITAARAMLAEAERKENDIVRASARKEIELLQRTIQSGQVKAATYSVQMPAGRLSIVAYSPSKCFVATACFGQDAWETAALRKWRDHFLLENSIGRLFVIWYYNNGEAIANSISHSFALRALARFCIGTIARLVVMNWRIERTEL